MGRYQGGCHSPRGKGGTESKASLALCPWTIIIQFPKALGEVQGLARPMPTQLTAVLVSLVSPSVPWASASRMKSSKLRAFPGRGGPLPLLELRGPWSLAPN